jgi:hypothetical protein
VLLRDGLLTYDGPVHEAITRYRRALADEDGAPSPNDGGPAGSGEARIAAASFVAVDGDARDRSSQGSRSGWSQLGAVAAPTSTSRCDGTGLLVAEEIVDPRAIGWNGGGEGIALRLDVPSPPLQFGRFGVGIALAGGDGRLLGRLPRAIPLLVYPDGEGRGLVGSEPGCGGMPADGTRPARTGRVDGLAPTSVQA